MKNKIRLYNTLTKRKETFKPLKKDSVGIYCCGPTVYWYQHIGNLRSYVNWDILKKVFLANGYNVNHVINVTDVGHLTSDADTGEDKMEKASKKERKSPRDIASYYFNVFKKDLDELNVSMPDVWPKATEHIKEQIKIIRDLGKKGFTYKTSDGIYFDTSKSKDYGKLGNINIEGLKAGKRISLGEKKNKTDFALWKFSPENENREQEWDSPWGVGFPGWHIECSAMSMKYLGDSFDIHTGGQEHIQVHHTNEIAQSEGATGKKFVNYWLHGAWLTDKGEKISKSKGGLYRLEELEEKGFSPMDLRYFFLSAHYRRPLNFSLEALKNSKNSLKRLKEIISKLDKEKKVKAKNIETAYNEFLVFLNDDLNFPRALSYMWEILRDNKLNETEKYKLILKFDKIFSLDLVKEESFKIPKEVRKLADEREKMRKEKKWSEADKIREKINKLGFILEDKERGYGLKKK